MVGGEQHGDIGQEVLGMTTGRRPPGDKETWWWNDEVKDAIRAKIEAKKNWDASGRQEERYIQACKQGGKERSSKIEGACDGSGVQGVGNTGGRTKYL